MLGQVVSIIVAAMRNHGATVVQGLPMYMRVRRFRQDPWHVGANRTDWAPYADYLAEFGRWFRDLPMFALYVVEDGYTRASVAAFMKRVIEPVCAALARLVCWQWNEKLK